MSTVIGKGTIHKCRYQISLAGMAATIRITGHGLKGMEAPYIMQHNLAKDGNIDRRDAARIADIMLDVIKRIEGLARMITAWGINAETGVTKLTPATQRAVRKSGSYPKNRNPLERIKV